MTDIDHSLYEKVIFLLHQLGKENNTKEKLLKIYQILTEEKAFPPTDIAVEIEQKDKISDRYDYFCSKTQALLGELYGEEKTQELLDTIYQLVQDKFAPSMAVDWYKWSENNVQLITYGDSIINDSSEEKPLVTLAHFLEQYLQNTLTGVHILPFNPYSSDDGFAVIDYLEVNPQLGDWDDIRHIAQHFNLMVDLVINHISSQHQWFQQFLAGEKPGCDYFIEVNPEEDLSQVVRPRSLPLLTEVETKLGTKNVWTTFSSDQIDVNFANPDVFIEYLKIIIFYLQLGIKYIRLDAVGFLWKKIGSSCIHLPQTHAVIRLIREIIQMLDPSVSIITETNVPNWENLSYFGNGNEAHMVYNFSLPPLLLNALMQGKSEHLKTWMMRMPPAQKGCAYFNFTASHDGIGLRPAEGLLKDDEYETLLATMEKFGGKISYRQKSDGSHSPYEINISWFSAMKGTVAGEDEWQIERFLCSQIIMLGLEGIPAFYIHSLLATDNDLENVKNNGHNRAINRHKWNYEKLVNCLNDPHSNQSIVIKDLSRLIKLRRQQPAFHPNATQYTLHPFNRALFAFWRQSIDREQSIFCIHNLSNKSQNLLLSQLNLIDLHGWFDLISNKNIDNIQHKYTLKPYQCLWITNYHRNQ
jgi:sucrose phosphorylase